MFTTTAGKLAAQKQVDIFEQPAEEFTLTQPEAPAIVKATKRGATFEKRGAVWVAIAHQKGRAVPLAEFHDTTQEAAAAAFCAYFNVKV